MLLQRIVHQLDGELVRLKSLRRVVAGLAKTPAVLRDIEPQPERQLPVEPLTVKREPSAAVPAVALPVAMEGAAKAVTVRGPGRPRRLSAPKAELQVMEARVHSRSRTPEPTALGKAASTGPVVISAAALVREREARMAAKAASPHPQPADAALEVLPEVSARELAARWLSASGKA